MNYSSYILEVLAREVQSDRHREARREQRLLKARQAIRKSRLKAK